MRVLITGANGQLGTDLALNLSLHHQVLAYGRQQLDVADFSRVVETVRSVKPDVIIHAAAYTRVDEAESQADKAFLVNAYGTRNLAVAAEQTGAKIIYISTDYVFDGRSCKPYGEFDPVGPLGVYGKSKLAGEKMVKSLTRSYFIVRTSWLYGKHGQNFVKTILQLAKERNQLKVVDDQTGTPTYTVDLADFLQKLMLTDKYGIYHASNQGSCSWYQFARAIAADARLNIEITPVATQEFPRPAPRPAYSVLDHMAIRLNGFDQFRHWREALQAFISDYL
ncbi:dTDP-4-dehydrorhamnose reductase [Brevibacillus humidisoli]|uniref:dTDP-4-dehydrorhamnose reductase n=1 Tax=Brevibacillus humidisoli TaxID=2895522 RepID=UPI001E3C7511|nr:dTDP-4-dehydrorhamnose reductase [Brevibacillus humidisoli]UFJ42537.1 dTDP-4-dehydrorhamnose reductase [Brevibacillus humidisoli]